MKMKRQILTLLGIVATAAMLGMWPAAVSADGVVESGACQDATSCNENNGVIKFGACTSIFSCNNNGRVIKHEACTGSASCNDNNAVIGKKPFKGYSNWLDSLTRVGISHRFGVGGRLTIPYHIAFWYENQYADISTACSSFRLYINCL